MPTETFTPYFTLANFPIDRPITVKELIKYLSDYDDNLSGDKIVATINFANNYNSERGKSRLKIMREAGTSYLDDDLFDESQIDEGTRAMNRRGFYQIVGDPEWVMQKNLKGETIRSIQAATVYCKELGSEWKINIMNVSPLINKLGFGFNIESLDQTLAYHASNLDGDKLEFISNLKGKVFYMTDQFWVKPDNIQYRLKHTIWLLLPKNFFNYLSYLNHYIPGTEILETPRQASMRY